MDYDGDVCVWRGVVVRVIDIDGVGGDVEVCYRVDGVVVGGALHSHDRVWCCACVQCCGWFAVAMTRLLLMCVVVQI